MSSIASVAVTAPMATPSTAAAAGSLQFDKAKCEAQLADWVHCVSASTPKGKAKIQELSLQLRGIDAKIQKAADAKPANDPAKATAARLSRPTDTLGNVVDVYA